jgi:dolichol-phosphate mannosyltransferase
MSTEQLVKFCVVGAIGTAVNLAVLWLLVELTGLNYLPASIAAFAVALTSNFIFNKAWTFRDRRAGSGLVAIQYARYLVVNVIALTVNLAVLLALVELAHLWYMAAQLVAILIATGINYTGSKAWSFR